MFQNPFGAVGALVAVVGVGLAIAGVFVGGEGRIGLLATGIFMALFGGMFVRVGRRIGKVVAFGSDLKESGIPGRGTVTEMWETGMTINDQPVFGFKLSVEMEDRPAYEASVQQLVPRMVAGAVLPGSMLAVKVDPEDHANIVVDWSVAPTPAAGASTPATSSPATPGAAAEALAAQGLGAVGGHVSLEELLRKGRRGKARLVEVRDIGEIGDLGLAERGDEAFDDRLFVIAMDVKLAGREPYRAQVAHRVPDRLIGRVGPGLEVVVAVDRDEPEKRVAIDWDASGV